MKDQKTIPSLLLKAGSSCGDTIAFHFYKQTWESITYSQCLETVRGIASHLMKTGIQKGDRIAVLSENRHEWCTAYLAISLAGAVAVPIDAPYGPEEIKNLLTDSESRIIFHSTKTQENLLNALKDLSSSFSAVPVNFDAALFRDICQTPHRESYPDISGDGIAPVKATVKVKNLFSYYERFFHTYRFHTDGTFF